MKVTVITVARNVQSTIEDTILSVASQDYIDREHIVIDGASTDRTVEVIQTHRLEIAQFISEPDRGIYDAMNKGIALASGGVIGFLNAGDIYTNDNVLRRVARVMEDEQLDACYADLVYVDQHDTDRITRYWKSRPYEPGSCRSGWMPAHPTFFARRSVYERAGGFDLAFPRQADFEMAVRLFEIHRIRSRYIPEVMVRMRTGGLSNNSVVGIIKGNIEAYRACKKHKLPVSPFFIPRKIMSRIPQFFQRPSGAQNQ